MAIYYESAAKKQLASNLIFLRTNRGLSQNQLYKKSGVSQKTISNLERTDIDDSPRISSVERLADYFRVPLASLLEIDLRSTNVDPHELSAWVASFSVLSESQQAVLLAIINEFKNMATD